MNWPRPLERCGPAGPDPSWLRQTTARADSDWSRASARLEACKKRGDAAVCCKVLDLDAARAELAGLDENLQRQELEAVLERAECLVRRQKIYEGAVPRGARATQGRPGA